MLLFAADSGSPACELWRSNGTAGGTQPVKEIHSTECSYNRHAFPAHLRAVGRTLFFESDDPTHGPELWTSDGTTAGTKLVKDINPAPRGPVPAT